MRHIETILERIPDGRAGRELVDGCLVLEGGAFRGLYTGGVVDALMQNGINIKTYYFWQKRVWDKETQTTPA